jgi:hypothetical protein
MGVSPHLRGSFLHRSNDSRMSAAPANIPLQAADNLGFGRIGISRQQVNAADDHSGSAIRALESAFIEKRLLHGVQLAVILETLNRGNWPGSHP